MNISTATRAKEDGINAWALMNLPLDQQIAANSKPDTSWMGCVGPRIFMRLPLGFTATNLLVRILSKT